MTWRRESEAANSERPYEKEPEPAGVLCGCCAVCALSLGAAPAPRPRPLAGNTEESFRVGRRQRISAEPTAGRGAGARAI